MRKLYFLLIAIVFCIVQPISAQELGGQFQPLQFSEHTYSIKMGDANYIPVWGIYVNGTTVGDIESSSATLATGFQILSSTTNAGIAYCKVRFASSNTPMPTGDYVIGYKETTNDTKSCTKAVVKSFHLYDAFDVDVALYNPTADASKCSGDGEWKGTDLSSTTTVTYRVFVNSPADDPGYIDTGDRNKWSFKFMIQATGVGGNATINSVTVTAEGTPALSVTPTFSVPANTSNYEWDCDVIPSSVSPLVFTVVYNDVLGVTQNVEFSINTILGTYFESDVDEATNTNLDGNKVSHTILAMPNVSEIEPWGI